MSHSDYPDPFWNEIKNSCPHLSNILNSGKNNCSVRLSIYGTGATMKGLNQFLEYLSDAETSFVENPNLANLEPLVGRVKGDFEVAIQAFFIGFPSVLYDMMRDVMEVEFLFRDFLLWPEHRQEWLKATDALRYRKFRPVVLRKRYAQWLGEKAEDIEEAKDYRLHSELLHVNPRKNQIAGRGIINDSDPALLRAYLLELVSHAKRIVFLLHRHQNLIPLEENLTAKSGPNLPLFNDAYDRCRRGIAMWWDIRPEDI